MPRSVTLAVADQRAYASVGEDFQQHCIGNPAVDDVRGGHAALYRFQCTADLGKHPAVDGAIGDQRVDLLGGQAGQYLAFLVHQPGDVGQQHQLFGLQCFSNLACDQVGVDVVGLAVGTHANRRDDWNEVAFDQHVQQIGIDTDDFANMTNVDDFRLGHLRCLTGHVHLFRTDQLRVFTGQADCAAAVTVDQVDDVLVDLAAQDHLYNVHGLGIGDAHAVDEMAFDGQALEQIANLRTAAVNDHRVDAHCLHQHDVAREAGFQLFALHGVAAVLDHQRLADEASDVRQRFGKDLGGIGCGITFEGHLGSTQKV